MIWENLKISKTRKSGFRFCWTKTRDDKGRDVMQDREILRSLVALGPAGFYISGAYDL